MANVKLDDLVRTLQRPSLRIRTGVVLLSVGLVGKESILAARLNLEHVDWRHWKIDRLDSASRFVDLSSETLVEDLRAMVQDPSVPGPCIWVHNVDLFVSSLPYDQREQFWSFLRLEFKEFRGLLLSLPQKSTHLLPLQERRYWETGQRLAELERV
jgi:hypothetical protein